MMDFGWKKKTERLRVVIVSAAHQMAKDLPAGTAAILDLFKRVAKAGGGQATMYLQSSQHWWLLHAVRRNEKEPSDKDIAVLDKVLDHLGADPNRDTIIGPRSSPAGEPRMVFGWWTWFNRWPLYEIQTNKAKRGKDMMRIVPHGTRASDGYQPVDLGDDSADNKDKS